MNSVTPVKNNSINFQRKGTGKGVALFFCVLFFLYQIVDTFFLSAHVVYQKKNLNIISQDILRFSNIATAQQAIRSSTLVSSTNVKFAPFFFEPIAINFGDIKMLMSIKGIGPDLAENIILTRNSAGNFTKPEDLLKVKGIGRSRMLKFSPYFSFTTDYD